MDKRAEKMGVVGVVGGGRLTGCVSRSHSSCCVGLANEWTSLWASPRSERQPEDVSSQGEPSAQKLSKVAQKSGEKKNNNYC